MKTTLLLCLLTLSQSACSWDEFTNTLDPAQILYDTGKNMCKENPNKCSSN